MIIIITKMMKSEDNKRKSRDTPILTGAAAKEVPSISSSSAIKKRNLSSSSSSSTGTATMNDVRGSAVAPIVSRRYPMKKEYQDGLYEGDISMDGERDGKGTMKYSGG